MGFQDAFERFEDGGWKGTVYSGILRLMYFASAAISGLWFAQVMPDLFLDPAQFPKLAPWSAALFGVCSMEAAVLAWDYQLKQRGLTSPQVFAAWVGLFSAVAMSIATTFAAIMKYFGASSDLVADQITAFVTGNGVAYYIALQLVLVILYQFVFSGAAQEARRRARIDANRNKGRSMVTQTASRAELAEMVSGQREQAIQAGRQSGQEQLRAALGELQTDNRPRQGQQQGGGGNQNQSRSNLPQGQPKPGNAQRAAGR